MRRRDPIKGWLAGLLCLGLAGCQSGGPKDERVAIRFSGYASNPAETELVRKLVQDFNGSQTEVQVSYEPVPGQYYPKMLTMLVSKTAPDVFYLDSLYFKPFLSKRILRPLDDLMKGSRLKRADFIPALFDAFTDGGTVYGIPKDFNALGFFFNRDSFDRAGIPYPDQTWTLETLAAVSKRLTRDKQTGFALTHDDADRYLPIATMFGASLFRKDRCTIDSPEGIRAMQYYFGLKQDGSAIYPAEVGTSWCGDAFGRQSVAMTFEGGWLIPYLKESFPEVRYGVAELPKGPKGRSNFLFTVAYVIPQASRHPEAAWKFIEYLTSEASQAQVTFALPSRRAISARYAKKHPAYRPLLAGAAYAKPYEFGPKGDRVKTRLGIAVQEVFLRTKTPAQALQEAAQEIDRIMKL